MGGGGGKGEDGAGEEKRTDGSAAEVEELVDGSGTHCCDS